MTRKINWSKVSVILTVLFGAQGMWIAQGFDQDYPDITRWINFLLPALTLFFKTHKEEPE